MKILIEITRKHYDSLLDRVAAGEVDYRVHKRNGKSKEYGMKNRLTVQLV
jgi:hypothetical protein